MRLVDEVELPAQAQVLDVGCGTGKLLNRLAQCWPDLTGSGLDLAAGMITQAQRATPHGDRLQFRRGDVTALPFPPHTFDAVFLLDQLFALSRSRRGVKEHCGGPQAHGTVLPGGFCPAYLVYLPGLAARHFSRRRRLLQRHGSRAVRGTSGAQVRSPPASARPSPDDAIFAPQRFPPLSASLCG